MFKDAQYHELIRKTVVAFGTLFNDMYVYRKNSTGKIIQKMKVPLAYGPKQKFLVRLDQDSARTAEDGKTTALTLPRIGFEMTTLTYDAPRKLNRIQKFRKSKSADSKSLQHSYMPVPYNIGFELGILAKSQDDGLGILEQILPYFQPSFNLPIKMIPDMDEIKDCPVVLNSVDYTDTYDGSFLNRRYLEYRMQFTVKTYLYGPVTNIGVIKKSIAEIGTLGDTSRRKDTRLTYTPKALEDKNADGNIDALDDALVQPDDNFGFNEGFEML